MRIVSQLPGATRRVLRFSYHLYVVSISLFSMAVAVLMIFRIYDVRVNTEALALLGIALIAPLIPFARQIGLPGDGSIVFGQERAELTIRTVSEGVDTTTAGIASAVENTARELEDIPFEADG